jgi:hypothetical protein
VDPVPDPLLLRKTGRAGNRRMHTLKIKKEVTCYSEMFASIYKTTLCANPENDDEKSPLP